MHVLNGSCHCGNVTIELSLTGAPEHYAPRACDCDLCTKHGASYLSDPNGLLIISVAEQDHLQTYRQGSKIADMLICRTCGDGRATW